MRLPLAESSKEFLIINTHMGLFQYNQPPFGVASEPAIFQQAMETRLHGLLGVSVYLEDILVTGSTLEEHLANLLEAGLRLDNAPIY